MLHPMSHHYVTPVFDYIPLFARHVASLTPLFKLISIIYKKNEIECKSDVSGVNLPIYGGLRVQQGDATAT